MILGALIDSVCNKLGQTDQASRDRCRDGIQIALHDIWDKFPWRDSEMSEVVTLNTNIIVKPHNMNRVIAIQAGSTFLDPANLNLLIQTDPTIFARSGPPKVYREFVQNGVNKIQFYPSPKDNITLLIVGKQILNDFVSETEY